MDWNLVLKITTGILIVPLTILASVAWEWWSGASIGLKILTAPVIFPLVILMYGLTPWWDGL